MPCCVLSIVDATRCWGASIDVVTFMVKGLPQHNVMLEPGIFGYCIFQQNSSHLCCISSCFKKRINIKVNGWCGVQAILKTRWAMFKTPHLRLASNSYLLHCIGGFIGGVTHQICKICACQGTQSCPKSNKACPAQVNLSVHPSFNIYRLILSSVSQSYHPQTPWCLVHRQWPIQSPCPAPKSYPMASFAD